MNQDDSNELRWIRQALEERNTLLKEQNNILKNIEKSLDNIYGAFP